MRRVLLKDSQRISYAILDDLALPVGAHPKLKILKSVVLLVAVAVVDRFLRQQGPAKMLAHY